MLNFLPLTAYRLPLTAYRLPLTAYRLPLTAYRLPLTAYRLPLTAYRSTACNLSALIVTMLKPARRSRPLRGINAVRVAVRAYRY
ncbi:hypothetical protein DJ023_16085 [Pantoea agglomerans]|nr:hypothetical protein [Pantoea agglomerans]